MMNSARVSGCGNTPVKQKYGMISTHSREYTRKNDKKIKKKNDFKNPKERLLLWTNCIWLSQPNDPPSTILVAPTPPYIASRARQTTKSQHRGSGTTSAFRRFEKTPFSTWRRVRRDKGGHCKKEPQIYKPPYMCPHVLYP